MPQRWVTLHNSFQHIRRTIPVLNSGAVDHQAQQEFNRVGDDMALAPFDPFTRIIPANTATFSGFYALAIFDPGCWLSFAALGQSRGLDQFAVHLIEQAIIAPGVEIAPNRRNRREVVGHDALVGVQCSLKRWCFSSHDLTSGVLWVA